MSMRTVRMEPEDDRILDRIKRQTGWTTTDTIKRGLRSLEKDIASEASTNAYGVFASLDLGPGGYAEGPASRTGETARRIIARKSGR